MQRGKQRKKGQKKILSKRSLMSCVSLEPFSAHTSRGLIRGQADKDLEEKGPPDLQGKE